MRILTAFFIISAASRFGNGFIFRGTPELFGAADVFKVEGSNRKAAMTRRTSLLISLLVIALPVVLFPILVAASDFRSGQNITLNMTDIIQDDLYLFCNDAEVNGKIVGDLSSFSYNFDSRAEILGNANIAAYEGELGGTVRRTARVFGMIVYINADIAGNALAIGNDIRIGKNTQIGRDLTVTGDDIRIDGDVRGNVHINGTRVEITGTIDGDVTIKARDITIIEPAVIKGNLEYNSVSEAYIDDDAVVMGETVWNEVVPEKEDGLRIPSALTAFFSVIFFLMTLATGLIIILFFRRHAGESGEVIIRRFWHTLATGLLTFILLTGGAILCLVLIVGIPITILITFLGLALFYLGKIYVSIAIGRFLVKSLGGGRRIAIGWEFVIGLIILTLIFRIPVLGWIVYIFTFILGMGAAISGYLSLSRKFRHLTETTPAESGDS